jgi:hypothetical protein
MAPNLIVVAFGTTGGRAPGEITPLLKNVLEKNGNKDYYQ